MYACLHRFQNKIWISKDLSPSQIQLRDNIVMLILQGENSYYYIESSELGFEPRQYTSDPTH